MCPNEETIAASLIENFREARSSPRDPTSLLAVTITQYFPKSEAGVRFLLRRLDRETEQPA
jgi:hypothetical protein